MTDWQPIRVEYITGSCSYRELAEKYGVSTTGLKTRGSREKWGEQRKAHREKVRSGAIEKISKKQEDILERVDTLSDRLLDALEQAADQLSEERGQVDRRGLQQLTRALKDLQQIKMLCKDRDSKPRIEVVLSAGPEEWNM